jgi:hypothetical protein
MNDIQIISFVSSLCLLLGLISYLYNKQFAIINIVIFLTYSISFYYGLYFYGEEGKSLGWLVLLIIITLIHIFFIGIYIIRKIMK